MRRLILAATLVAFVQTGAVARAPMETNQLVDDNGMPIGTAANPLYVSGGIGGGGGSGGAVTQGPAATDIPANRWPVVAYQGGAWTFGLSGPIPAGSNVIGAVTQSGGPWTVSGTVAATQSGPWNVGLNAGTNQIGSVLADLRVGGAANAAGNPIFAQITNFPATQTVAGTVAVSNAFLLDGTFTGRVPTNGQKTMAASLPVVLPSDQTIAADGTGTNPGSGARGWLSGIYARLGGTLNVVIGAGANTIGAVTQAGTWAVNSTLQAGSAIIGRVGIDQTTQGTTNGVVVNSSALPAGGATSANQATEITALNAIAGRIQTFTDYSNTAAAASADNLGPIRTVGTGYTRYNAVVATSQSGKAQILGCATSDCSSGAFYILASSDITSAAPAVFTIPIPTPYVRVRYTNGTTAGAFNINSALTAN